MGTFVYEALNAAGKPQKGTVDAVTTEEAIQRIKAQGYYPTSVREQQVKKTDIAADAAGDAERRRKRAVPSRSAAWAPSR